MSLYGSIGIGPLRVGASTRGGGGGNNVAGTLLVLAIGVPIFLAITYWYVTLAIVGLALVGTVVVFAAAEIEQRVSDENRKRADLVHRAESQHARLMDGDESALYGDYPPATL